MDFDYYKDAATEKFGLVRTATLIEQARAEVKNSVLVDNGDVIQGSPLGDYMAAKGLKEGDVHPVYKAMNTLNYAVGNLGNHEFNYGLDFLHKACLLYTSGLFHGGGNLRQRSRHGRARHTIFAGSPGRWPDPLHLSPG